MPTAPTARMKALAKRWHTSTIRIYTETRSVDVDPETGQPATVVGYDWTGPAVIQQVAATRDLTTPDRAFGLADLVVGVDDDAAPARGMTIDIVASQDGRLAGKTGTITTVDMSQTDVRRRLEVRLESTS